MLNNPAERLRATLALDEPVGKVPLVSPARAKALEALGIVTVRDLVTHFPRRYLDLSRVETVASCKVGEECSIKAQVHSIQLKKPRPRLALVEITLVDGTGTLIVTCFRQPWLMDSIKPGMTLAVAGKVTMDYGFKRMTNPFIERLEDDSYAGKVVPIHPACEKVSAAWMRRLIGNALALSEGAYDPLPLPLRAKYRLVGRQHALRGIHFPLSMEEMAQARRRLAFEELFFLQLMVIREANERERGKAPVAHAVDGPSRTALAAHLPFELTGGQKAAIAEISQAMAAPHAMNHLLLGDVGTGKTVVAAFACCMAHDTGGQAIVLAPTEVLATQHAKSLGSLFDAVGVRWALLTGGTDAGERARIVDAAAAGGVDVLIGTHALLEPDVVLRRCTLAVIDEQQRFGVEQRAAILAKGGAVDALYLTATPIPRTLALALYGDLTLSYLREKPQGAGQRTTHVLARQDRGIAYDAVKEALARGEQAYIVCPLIGGKDVPGRTRDDEDGYVYGTITIEDDGDFDLGGNASEATKLAERLQSTVYCDYTVGLLHGRLGAEKKAQVMERFRKGEVDVLVSTTVIEVGVDVPNATAMIIEDADRFGLSQLHQLRGRVGRGGLPGQVYLVSGNPSDDAVKRLRAMESTEDGFELASYDLSLRREGDILGNRQHGASALKLVNVVKDAEMVAVANKEARSLLAGDPFLEAPEHQALWREIRMAFKDNHVKQGG